jgi:pimeloyl-ACP methyl ester carboxylesterase
MNMKRIIKRIVLSIISIIISILIITFCANLILLKIESKKYPPPGMMVKVKDQQMHLYIEGNGNNKIVILPGVGSSSPYIEYKTLVKELSTTYTTVVVEYFGYGWSDLTNSPRTTANIVDEMRTALMNAGILPPYILVPHSISGLYSLYYANKYPEEIKAIIGLDITVPKQILYENKISPLFYFDILRKMGIIRLAINILPSLYYLPVFSNKNYSKEDINIFKAMICRNYLNTTIDNEVNMYTKNANDLIDYIFPNSIPITIVIANDTQKMTQKLNWKEDWITLHKNMILNNKTGEIILMDGGHNIFWNNEIEIERIVRDTISGQ